MINKLTQRAQPWTLLLAVIFLLGFVPSARAESRAAAPAAQGNPAFEKAACMFKMPSGWEEGKDVTCGYLTVPAEYAHPDGATIQLAVAIVHSKDPNPKPDPLVMLQGGPGGSTIDTYTQILPLYGRLPGNRDVVLFDQRGTLYSKPALACPEFLDLTLQTLDKDLSNEESNRLSLEALKKCRDRLAGDGVNLSDYDSLENAADIQSLAKALGYAKINLYGVSYGTLLALHALRAYPDLMRSVIIDSVVPPQRNFITGAPQAENRSFEALFSACQADAGCNQAYPDLREVFYGLADQLTAKPITIQLTDTDSGKTYPALVNGEALISTVFQMMHNTEFIPLIPRIIFDARAGKWDVIERVLSQVVFDKTMSLGMYYSVVCSEDADFTVSEYDLKGLPRQLLAAEEGSAQSYLDACKLWNVKELGPAADAPVQSSVPTLILTGAFDPITPPAYAQQAAETLANHYLVLFPSGGHGEVGSSACADKILLEFIDDPAKAPDTACLKESPAPRFVTSKNLVRLPVLIKMLSFAGGTGAQLLVYMLALLFLLTALFVYPLAWVVGLFRRRPAPAAGPAASPFAAPLYAPETVDGLPAQDTAASRPRPRPVLYKLSPWLGWLAALALLVFTIAMVTVTFQLAMANDARVLLGLPGEYRALFLLPALFSLLTVLLTFAAFAGWLRRSGSVWGRLYLSLLVIAAWLCLVILAGWGMLSALII